MFSTKPINLFRMELHLRKLIIMDFLLGLGPYTQVIRPGPAPSHSKPACGARFCHSHCAAFSGTLALRLSTTIAPTTCQRPFVFLPSFFQSNPQMAHNASSQPPAMPEMGEDAAAVKRSKRENQLAVLRAKYNVPSTAIMRVPEAGEKVSEPDDDELGFFDDALVAGCRFPLSREIRELLFLYSLAPSQLAPDGWRLALAFFALWRKLFAKENPQPWREFMHCYKIAKMG